MATSPGRPVGFDRESARRIARATKYVEGSIRGGGGIPPRGRYPIARGGNGGGFAQASADLAPGATVDATLYNDDDTLSSTVVSLKNRWTKTTFATGDKIYYNIINGAYVALIAEC